MIWEFVHKVAHTYVLASNVIFLLFALGLMIAGGIGHSKVADAENEIEALKDFPLRPIAGGIIATGVLLFWIAVVGLVGAIKRHKKFLSFYSIALFLIVLLQISIAIVLGSAFGSELTQQIDDSISVKWTKWYNEENESGSLPKDSGRQLILQYQGKLKCCGYKEIPGHPLNDMVLDPWFDFGETKEKVGEDHNVETNPALRAGFLYHCKYWEDPDTGLTREPCFWKDDEYTPNDLAKCEASLSDDPSDDQVVQPCRDATIDFFENLSKPILIVAIVLGVFEALAVVFTCTIMCRSQQLDDDDDIWKSAYSY
ncbi:MAG: hypothetical protein MHM6MM_008191 [Cercozoa sp. M6MM]